MFLNHPWEFIHLQAVEKQRQLIDEARLHRLLRGERALLTRPAQESKGRSAVLGGHRAQSFDKGDKYMKIAASSLIRWAGLAAMGAGIVFAVIQPIHPPDVNVRQIRLENRSTSTNDLSNQT